MKRRTKSIMTVIAMTGLLLASTLVCCAENNGWVKEKEGGQTVWHYYQNEKMKILSWIYDAERDSWYYVDEDGVMLTGWGTGYAEGCYFNESGEMQIGWQQLYAPEESNFTPSTPLYWYYFGSDGQMQTGWLKVKNVWYYFSEGQIDGYQEGQMVTGLVTIQGSTYYFDESSGVLQKGKMLNLDGGKYYFSANGIMKKNSWVKLDNATYYVGEDGKALMGTSSSDLYVTMIDSVVYAFNSNGKMITSRTIYYVDGSWTLARPVQSGEYSTYVMNAYGKGTAGTYVIYE